MRIPKCFTLMAFAMLPLLAGFSQTVNPSTAPQANAPATLLPSADEVVRLAQSGVDNQVVLAFIEQSHSCYNLSGAGITALKNAGVSSQVLMAMLDHDSALRAQVQSSSALAATTVAPQPTVTQPGAVPATPITSQTPTTTTVVIQSDPPPPEVEVVPISPGPDYLWTPGWWSWNGGAWIWIGGRWHYPVRPAHVWFNGNFNHGRGAEPFRGGHRR